MNEEESKLRDILICNDIHKLDEFCEKHGTEHLVRNSLIIPKSGVEDESIKFYNLSAIHVCAYFNSTECILYIFDKGISPNLKSSDGFSPLHFAILGEALDAVVTLLHIGADINYCPKATYLTPLFLASRFNNIDIVNSLIHYNATYTTFNDKTPAKEALRCGNTEIFKTLLKYETNSSKNMKNFTPLMMAIANKMDEAIDILLNYGDINSISPNGISALSLACQARNFELVEKLIVNGKASLKISGAGGSSVIHWASQTCLPKLVLFVIEHGADPKAKTNRGETAISFALRFRATDEKQINEMIETLRILNRSGLSFNDVLNDGSLPLLEYLVDKTKINAKVLQYIFSTNIDLDMRIGATTLQNFLSKMKFGTHQKLIDELLNK